MLSWDAVPMNQEQLAADVHVQSQTLGRVLTRLEAAGFVSRERDTQDRRQFHVKMTDAGEPALRAAQKAEVGALPSDFDGWETLQEHLSRLVNSFQNHRHTPGQTHA